MKRTLLAFSMATCIGLLASHVVADDTTTSNVNETTTANAEGDAPQAPAADGATAGADKAKPPQKKAVPLKRQLADVLRKMAPKLKGKRIMTAAVPHYENSKDHWPAAPAVLQELLVQLETSEYEVPARVEHLILGDKAVPPKELIDDLQGQFPFDLLMTVDYRRSETQIQVGLRLFDAKTRKLLDRQVMDLGNEVAALGYNENRKVWEYCHSMQGYMVGNGECWTLAASALAVSEAQHPYVYQYGSPVAVDDLLIPGDLFQFEGVVMGTGVGVLTMGHHTAVVYNNLGGGIIDMVHQNGPPLGRYVAQLQVNIHTQRSGVIAPYRPEPRQTAAE